MQCARSPHWLLASVASLLLASAGVAQTVTVDTVDDVIDIDPDAATVTDLPGPDGRVSFSEAAIASNNTPGRQTIAFAIPATDWNYLAWYLPGRAVVHTVGGNYWRFSDEVTIDGRTQTDAVGDTNPDGAEVVLWGSAVYLNAGNCWVFGLDSSTVVATDSGARIEDNTEMGIELFGGSGSLVKDNTGGYIKIDRSSNNVVVGNTVLRLRVLGWIDGGQPAVDNRIGGPALADRNHIIGMGTRNSQGIPGGYALQIFDAIGTIIENNWIGMSLDGMQQGHPWTTTGIGFDGEHHNTIVRNNRVAGILGHASPPHGPPYVTGTAIQVYGEGSGVSIVGNQIGLNADNEPVLGSITGIAMLNYYLGPVSDVVIGGAGLGEGNEIAGHLVSGITVAHTFTGVRISANSIHDNGNLGIDLIGAALTGGVTPNDSGDADSGGNALQNFPIVSSASDGGSTISLSGSLDSLADEAFTLEFFASPACGPLGHGEGSTFIGAATISTDGTGHSSFNITLPWAAAGSVITATATQVATANTSEFSPCATISGGLCRSDFNTDGFVDPDDLSDFLTCFFLELLAPMTCPDADFNADGFTDPDDLSDFVTQFFLSVQFGC